MQLLPHCTTWSTEPNYGHALLLEKLGHSPLSSTTCQLAANADQLCSAISLRTAMVVNTNESSQQKTVLACNISVCVCVCVCVCLRVGTGKCSWQQQYKGDASIVRKCVIVISIKEFLVSRLCTCVAQCRSSIPWDFLVIDYTYSY